MSVTERVLWKFLAWFSGNRGDIAMISAPRGDLDPPRAPGADDCRYLTDRELELEVRALMSHWM
jgi:hypothetical protein